MGSTEWNNAAHLKFISLYEQNTCLWKADCPTYRNRKAREDAINRIVETMAFPDFKALECKTKIKNLRSHYIQVLKKIKNSRIRSPTGEASYKPKLAWFKSLDRFLSPYISTLTNKCHASKTDPTSDAQGDGDPSEDVMSPPEAMAASQLDHAPYEGKFTDSMSQEDTRSPQPGTPQCDHADDSNACLEDRKPMTMMDLDISKAPCVDQPELPSSDHRIAESMTVNVTPGEKDVELEAFARSVVAQLRNMPFPVALQLQLKIQTLITEERLRLMRSPPI